MACCVPVVLNQNDLSFIYSLFRPEGPFPWGVKANGFSFHDNQVCMSFLMFHLLKATCSDGGPAQQRASDKYLLLFSVCSFCTLAAIIHVFVDPQ